MSALELVGDRHQADGGRVPPPAEVVASPPPEDPAPAQRSAGSGSAQPPERVVPAERFARLLALMTRLLSACGESAEAQIPVAELREGLNLDKKVLEDDIGLLNLINFGGGCYALYAQIEGDTVVVQKETYGDRFSRPARLSPLEAKALLWALEFIGDRLPAEDGRSLELVRGKLEAAIGEDDLPTVELGRAQVADTGVAAAVSQAIREDRVLEIDYWTESRGAITRRAIEPHLLVNAQDAWYVVAYCRRARRPADVPARPHPQREPAGRALRAPPRDRDAGPYMPWGACRSPAGRSPRARRSGAPRRSPAGCSRSTARASASPTARSWSRSPTPARSGW